MKTSNKRELRTYAAAQPLEVRTLADGSKQVSGYAIVWNSPSCDLGGFTEICAPTMLDRTLRERPDILALRDHKQELLLGRTSAKTLELKTDSTGLLFIITLPKTNVGDDTAENVRLRNLTGCSFGFVTRDDSWVADATGNVVRTLLDVELLEISLCSFPAYLSTSVDLRSMPAQFRKSIRADDSDEDEDESSDGCECDCEACLAGHCDECDNPDCHDPNCLDNGCPQQDDTRCDRLRVRLHFASVLRSLTHS